MPRTISVITLHKTKAVAMVLAHALAVANALAAAKPIRVKKKRGSI